VDDGFALVKVPGSPGVRVLANNQLEGRTNRRGSLFVPDLRSYLSSPIGIVQDDLPVEMRLGAISQDIAVPYRGGAVVVFEAKIIRALSGRLDVAGKAPEYGTLTVTVGATEFSSPLNASGEFYFEDLPPGDHSGIASWSGRSCRATIHMPDKAPPMTDAGVVTCVEGPQ
jgi:outer membrane usher protein